MAGGISDLYLLDLAAGTVRQLTNDRYADIQPDVVAGRQDDRLLDRSRHDDGLQEDDLLAAAAGDDRRRDGADQRVQRRSRAGSTSIRSTRPTGRASSSSAIRTASATSTGSQLASGTVTRVTRLSTGVSGITAISPALTVAPSTGRMLFSVFQDQGYAVYALDSMRTHGEPLVLGVEHRRRGRAAPGRHAGPRDGHELPAAIRRRDFRRARTSSIAPYHSSFALDAVGQPTLGVVGRRTVRHRRGGRRVVPLRRSAQRSPDRRRRPGERHRAGHRRRRCIFQNLKHRWNYGASVQHVPYLTGYYTGRRARPGLLRAGPHPAAHLHRRGGLLRGVSVLVDEAHRVQPLGHAARLQHADPAAARRRRGQRVRPAGRRHDVARSDLLRPGERRARR